MEINKSVTITAKKVNKTAMQFNYVERDGEGWVLYQQGYQFADADGNPVHGIQKEHLVQGEIKYSDLQAALPKIAAALTELWVFFENEIRKQEAL
jgi:hypothetical protein